MEGNNSFSNIDEYILNFPIAVQEKLNELRRAIKEWVPETKEKISYQMPTFELNGKNLVHFAAFKKHIGFYPGAVVVIFQEELKEYKTSKGAIQFPIDQPLPFEIIKKIVQYKVEENVKKVELKK